jgi:HlyD family secretion protein
MPILNKFSKWRIDVKKGSTKKIVIGSIIGVLMIGGGFLGYQVLADSATTQYTKTTVTVGNT